MENIRDKSIFDFCDDQKLLATYSGGYTDKSEYLAKLSTLPQWEADAYRIFAIIDYANDMKDEELHKAIISQCSDIIARFFNE